MDRTICICLHQDGVECTGAFCCCPGDDEPAIRVLHDGEHFSLGEWERQGYFIPLEEFPIAVKQEQLGRCLAIEQAVGLVSKNSIIAAGCFKDDIPCFIQIWFTVEGLPYFLAIHVQFEQQYEFCGNRLYDGFSPTFQKRI